MPRGRLAAARNELHSAMAMRQRICVRVMQRRECGRRVLRERPGSCSTASLAAEGRILLARTSTATPMGVR